MEARWRAAVDWVRREPRRGDAGALSVEFDEAGAAAAEELAVLWESLLSVSALLFSCSYSAYKAFLKNSTPKTEASLQTNKSLGDSKSSC